MTNLAGLQRHAAEDNDLSYSGRLAMPAAATQEQRYRIRGAELSRRLR